MARTRLRVVAERAGVSVATAPPVMTDGPSVGIYGPTRERVGAAAETLGCSPVARCIRCRPVRSFGAVVERGLVIPDPESGEQEVVRRVPRVGHLRLATVADERGRQTAVLCLSVATAALIYLVAGARGLRVPNGPSVPIHRDAELPAVELERSVAFLVLPVKEVLLPGGSRAPMERLGGLSSSVGAETPGRSTSKLPGVDVDAPIEVLVTTGFRRAAAVETARHAVGARTKPLQIAPGERDSTHA